MQTLNLKLIEAMECVTLTLLDRQKRVRNKLLAYFVLAPLGIFFYGCFRVRRHAIQTIFEAEFGFESYWRLVGIIGLIIVFILFVSLSKLLPFSNGTIQLCKDKIKIANGAKDGDYPVQSLKDFEFLTDVPFDGDDRTDFEKASILKFNHNGKKYNFEVSTDSKSQLEAITPIIKSWKELNAEFKYGYK